MYDGAFKNHSKSIVHVCLVVNPKVFYLVIRYTYLQGMFLKNVRIIIGAPIIDKTGNTCMYLTEKNAVATPTPLR